MEFASYLEPAVNHWEEHFDGNSSELIGSKISFHQDDILDSIVLLGYIPHYLTTNEKKSFRETLLKIKSAVYQLAFHESWTTNWVDLGIFISSTKNDENVFFKLLEFIHTKGGKALILTFSERDWVNFLSNPLLVENINHIGIISNQLHLKDELNNPTKDNYLRFLIENFPERFTNISILGVQQHYITPIESRISGAIGIYQLRLSEIEKDPTKAEPLLREAVSVCIDLNALEFLGYKVGNRSYANGLSNREICVLSRYAGASTHLKNIFLSNIYKDIDDIGAALIAQILWYIADGVNFNTNLPKTKKVKRFEVLLSGETITFEYEETSERWWIAIPEEICSNAVSSRIPCNEIDYKEAMHGKIPEIMLNFFKKNT